MADLAGKHVVVTGASRGIGAAIARRLAELGGVLTLMGRDQEALQGVCASLPASAKAHGLVCDVAQPKAVTQAFAQARAALGPIAVLVNNAGQAESAPFLKTSLEMFQQMLAVNLTGTFLCSQAALPDMLRARAGRIVNVASTAGLRGYAYVAAYAAAKHGVIGLTRSLALEMAQRGITVNAVCPGYTDTDMTHNTIARVVAKTGRTANEALAELLRFNPQGRLIAPEEVADAVAWLCGDAAASVTGQAISLSGGEVM